MVNYDVFWETLKKKKVSTYVLREKYNISPSVFTRMKRNDFLNLRTIDDFCKILDCDIQDIVVYVPDE